MNETFEERLLEAAGELLSNPPAEYAAEYTGALIAGEFEGKALFTLAIFSHPLKVERNLETLQRCLQALN